MEDEYLPNDDISFGLFLLRKSDGKRLELTADASFHDGRFWDDWDEEWDESKQFGESYLQWDLSMNDIPSPLLVDSANVRFEAHIVWKDGKEHAQPPAGVNDDELDEWNDNNLMHEPELLLSSLDIRLLAEKTDVTEYGDSVEKNRPGPDAMLEMLRNPIFESRWM